MKRGKKGAIELSVSTIVIIVLAMIMLILGIVLVRSIMCGAVGLTDELNTKIIGQINDLFQSTGGEVACIGSGSESVTLVIGRYNYIYCAINAPKEAEYEIKIKSITGDISTEREIEKWITGPEGIKKTIPPGETGKEPQKILRLDVPGNAPKDLITIDVEVYRDGELIYSPTLDFEVRDIGFFRNAMC